MKTVSTLALLAISITTTAQTKIPNNIFPRSFLLRYTCPEVASIHINTQTHIATGEGEIDGCRGIYQDFICTNSADWEFAPPAPLFQGQSSSTIKPTRLTNSEVIDIDNGDVRFSCNYDNGLELGYIIENYDEKFARLFSDHTLHYLTQIG